MRRQTKTENELFEKKRQIRIKFAIVELLLFNDCTGQKHIAFKYILIIIKV